MAYEDLAPVIAGHNEMSDLRRGSLRKPASGLDDVAWARGIEALQFAEAPSSDWVLGDGRAVAGCVSR